MTASFVAASLMDSLGRRSLLIMSFSGMVRFNVPSMLGIMEALIFVQLFVTARLPLKFETAKKSCTCLISFVFYLSEYYSFFLLKLLGATAILRGHNEPIANGLKYIKSTGNYQISFLKLI